jgi:chorismate mutase
MSADAARLDQIRSKIDEIDEAIHRKLMERGKLIEDLQAAKGVGAAPGGTGAMRPAREARMMRALAGRHRGAFPLIAAERIWREIITAFTQLQAPFSVLAAGRPEGELMETARFYFGVTTPVELGEDPGEVVRAVGADPHLVGVIVRPLDDEYGLGGPPWWRALALGETGRARIVARLPFLREVSEADPFSREAWLVSQAPFDASGGDVTLFGVADREGDAATTVARTLGVDASACALLAEIGKEAGGPLSVVAVGGHYPGDILAETDGAGVLHMGGYAVLAETGTER